jgi:hypothetical protein
MGWIAVLLVLGMVLGAGISIDPLVFSFGCASPLNLVMIIRLINFLKIIIYF